MTLPLLFRLTYGVEWSLCFFACSASEWTCISRHVAPSTYYYYYILKVCMPWETDDVCHASRTCDQPSGASCWRFSRRYRRSWSSCPPHASLLGVYSYEDRTRLKQSVSNSTFCNKSWTKGHFSPMFWLIAKRMSHCFECLVPSSKAKHPDLIPDCDSVTLWCKC